MNKGKKLETAKKLLWEVKQEEIKEMQENNDKIKNHICICNHKRERHGKSYSINYTDGFCQDCDCGWFDYSVSLNN